MPDFTGALHMFVAFDWGDEIELEQTRRLIPAESLALARRSRTPTSFTYHPPPLQLSIDATPVRLGPLTTPAPARVTLFDFAAVSVSLRVPFVLSQEQLLQLAGTLADSSAQVMCVRQAIMPLFQQLLPAIRGANFSEDLIEEYFVFEFAPSPPAPLPEYRERGDHPMRWLGNLVHLDSSSLSSQEIDEALRLQISYSPNDLLVADWAAAVLFDRDCEETLQVIEFANSQLVQYRSIDSRLDASFAQADDMIRRVNRGWFPFWRLFNRPLRKLGELRVDANALFERTSNALKLIGDPYLARVYRLLSTRFHLDTWEKSILRKLGATEDVYQVASDQASTFRAELLEVLIVLLIVFEIVMAFFH